MNVCLSVAAAAGGGGGRETSEVVVARWLTVLVYSI